MTQEMHLLGETIQEITLYAWPIVYNDNKYDIGSTETLSMLRDWAEEFEKWWRSHDEDWVANNDFILEVEAFAEKKCQEFVQSHS